MLSTRFSVSIMVLLLLWGARGPSVDWRQPCDMTAMVWCQAGVYQESFSPHFLLSIEVLQLSTETLIVWQEWLSYHWQDQSHQPVKRFKLPTSNWKLLFQLSRLERDVNNRRGEEELIKLQGKTTTPAQLAQSKSHSSSISQYKLYHALRMSL